MFLRPTLPDILSLFCPETSLPPAVCVNLNTLGSISMNFFDVQYAYTVSLSVNGVIAA